VRNDQPSWKVMAPSLVTIDVAALGGISTSSPVADVKRTLSDSP
jgi:hypothetical protein